MELQCKKAIDKLKAMFGDDTAGIAKRLGMKEEKLQDCITNNNIPYEELFSFCLKHNIEINSVLKG